MTPPWPPRASAALTTGWDSTSAWLASGGEAAAHAIPCGCASLDQPPGAGMGLVLGTLTPLPTPGAGMNFVDGMPSTPVYSDAYLIDAGVCLLAPSTGKVRRRMGGEERLVECGALQLCCTVTGRPLNYRCFCSICRCAMAPLLAPPT